MQAEITIPPTAAGRPQGCTNFKLRQLLRRVGQHYDAEMAKWWDPLESTCRHASLSIL